MTEVAGSLWSGQGTVAFREPRIDNRTVARLRRGLQRSFRSPDPRQFRALRSPSGRRAADPGTADAPLRVRPRSAVALPERPPSAASASESPPGAQE
jgi:hypothetical protein